MVEEASFTSAAAREGATQSGISQHIKQLETDLGIALFERNGRDIVPTPAGAQYYRDCIDVLKRLGAAGQRIAQARDAVAIRIGLMPTFTRSLLPPVLDTFLATMPGAEVNVIEAYSGVLTEMTLKGELDFAVVPAFEGRVGISQQLIARDREMLVRAKTATGDADMQPVRLSAQGPLKVVLPGRQNTRRRNLETYFGVNGVELAQRLELDAMMGTLQFVAESDWVAILPFIMMVSDLGGGRFEIRPLDEPPLYSEFVLIEPARKTMSAAAATFAALIKTEAERAQSVFRGRMNR